MRPEAGQQWPGAGDIHAGVQMLGRPRTLGAARPPCHARLAAGGPDRGRPAAINRQNHNPANPFVFLFCPACHLFLSIHFFSTKMAVKAVLAVNQARIQKKWRYKWRYGNSFDHKSGYILNQQNRPIFGGRQKKRFWRYDGGFAGMWTAEKMGRAPRRTGRGYAAPGGTGAGARGSGVHKALRSL